MRIKITFEFEKQTIPIDYRRGFLSILKHCLNISENDLYERLYGKQEIKPFSFAVNLGSKVKFNKVDRVIELDKTPKTLTISCNSPETITHLYNGIRKINEYPFFQNKFLRNIKEHRIYLQHESKISADCEVFKTLSPVLVKIPETEKYLLPHSPDFELALNHHLKICCENFTNIPFTPVSFKNISTKKQVIFHYGFLFDAFTGRFLIEGKNEILKLIYDVGLGVRRSQGFGLLEVLK